MKQSKRLLVVSAVLIFFSFAFVEKKKSNQPRQTCYWFKVVNNTSSCATVVLEFPDVFGPPPPLVPQCTSGSNYICALGFQNYTIRDGKYVPANQSGIEITDYCNNTCIQRKD